MVIIVGAPSYLSVAGGTPQSTTVRTAFPQALQVVVLDDSGDPVSGVLVTFSAPAGGASAVLSSSTTTTDSEGFASVTAIANPTPGRYQVTATVAGLEPVSFDLTNLQIEAIPLLDWRGMIGLMSLLLALGALALRRG